ncbi:FtsX-like permease family protein [Microbacterium thalli]|uniref:FtsX-like permease family protein n=1 Tax=Microbacterium thalli TaxID=3027921 RepID=UPI002366F251|nr:FtsX-like permease family protein [Microbacterium thalli]MDD7928907.1 FtsX-like permease family protein [Microbacterium thalli]
MGGISLATLRERWSLFVGAGLSTALGVALVHSSLLLLITAASAAPPADASGVAATTHAASTIVAVTVLAVTVAFAAFLAFFIIGTTFAFTVDQRSRDIALLRLMGAERRQVRRLLVGESVVLGVVASVVGMPLGAALMAIHARVLEALRFVPPGFTGQGQGWIVGVDLGVGIGLAVSGVLLAARRASGIPPLAALRDGEAAVTVMTRTRWFLAALFVAAAVVLLVLVPVTGAAGGQALAMNVSIVAAIGLTAAAPVLVPVFAGLLPGRAGGIAGLLAGASLSDNVRRSASTAAPLVILVGILVGQSVSLVSFGAAGAAQERRDTVADLVVESPVLSAAEQRRLRQVAGVVSVSTEVTVPAEITTGEGEMAFTEVGTLRVIEPDDYAIAHPSRPALGELSETSAAAGPASIGLSAGDRVGVRWGETTLPPLEIIARMPETLAPGATLLVAADAIPAEAMSGATAVSFVSVDSPAEMGPVADALAAFGSVSDVEAWSQRAATTGVRTAESILLVVLGLGVLYSIIGVINSIVIAAGARRREFAVARATGLTRAQVVRTTMLESASVTTAGLLLGLLAAAGTVVATAILTSSVTGSATLVVPGALIATTVVGAYVVTGATTAVTTMRATATPPVMQLRSRE